jgi:hypothetical protein
MRGAFLPVDGHLSASYDEEFESAGSRFDVVICSPLNGICLLNSCNS